MLRAWVPGTVLTQAWLSRQGIGRQLADVYVNSGWLERVGRGVYRRAGNAPGWAGAVHGLQQLNSPSVHIGGETALVQHGHGHFASTGAPDVHLYGPPGTRLPKWVLENDWRASMQYHTASLFNEQGEQLGVLEKSVDGIPLRMSSVERALLEVMHDVPERVTVGAALNYVNAATTVRPQLMQQLLENCRSVKVKRLVLQFSDHAAHRWVRRLNVSAIDLGSGKRVLGGGGYYYPNYQVSLPEDLNSAGDST